jgi:hypothetical protein
MGYRLGVGVLGLVVCEDNRRRTTELSDSISDSHAFSKSDDADFNLEEVDVKLKEDVTCDFLFWESDIG